MNPNKGWVLLTHSHDRFPRFDEAEILDVLPDEIRDGPRERVRVHGTGDIEDLTRIDWHELQREQAAQYESLLVPLRNEGRGIVYFGRAYIPLALDLGYRTENWTRTKVFQYQRQDQSWRWPNMNHDRPVLEPMIEHNLPSRPSDSDGPIVVRVSASSRIARDDVKQKVPNPVADIEVHLGEYCGVTALQTADDLERVAKKFEEALYLAHDRLPHTSSIHLFAAVPVALAFRMGNILGGNVHPLVHTYKYVPYAPVKYHKAVHLGQLARPDMKLRIQFLSAEPDTTKRLRVGREHREINQRLRDGEHRERFDLIEPRSAVRVTDLQAYISRGRAQIVHFSGHGEPGGYLLLESQAGTPQRIAPESLRILLDTWNEDQHIRCVVINACHSHELAALLVREADGIPCAIGTEQAISDIAARCFSEGFYGALADGHALGKAFQAGCAQVSLESPSEAKLFQLEVAEESFKNKPLFIP